MEPDGISRVWRDMQEPRLYRILGINEMYPKNYDLDEDVLVGNDADQIKSEADAAYRYESEDNPDLFSGPLRFHWITAIVIATGEVIRLDDFDWSDHPYNHAMMVVERLEARLGKTGLTVILSQEFGFQEH